MITAADLYHEAACCAIHAIEWRYVFPGSEYAPFVNAGDAVNRAHAVALLEWAGREDHPTGAVTLAIGQAVRLSNGGSSGLGWMRILRDTIDVLRDYANDLEASQ